MFSKYINGYYHLLMVTIHQSTPMTGASHLPSVAGGGGTVARSLWDPCRWVDLNLEVLARRPGQKAGEGWNLEPWGHGEGNSGELMVK